MKKFKFLSGALDCREQEVRGAIVDAGVSIDGSWSSRGWCARDGVVAAISIDTGKVLDVIYLTNTCTACTHKENQRNKGDLSRMDFLKWYVDHEPQCFLNHAGSSQVSLLNILPQLDRKS